MQNREKPPKHRENLLKAAAKTCIKWPRVGARKAQKHKKIGGENLGGMRFGHGAMNDECLCVVLW
jgi:hypothetical protein